MRVATFNILSGRSPGAASVDAAGFTAAIRALDVDVLALQEVDRDQPRSAGVDLTSVAAAAMGAAAQRFCAALAGRPDAWTAATDTEPPGTPAYGVALLSRFPVTDWRVVRLPAFPGRVPMWLPGRRLPLPVRDEPRVALVARVRAPGRVVTAVATHLSFAPWSNRRQLRWLMGAVADDSRPLLLLGDLNTGRQRAERLTGMRALADVATFPAHTPGRQLDHVLVDGPLRAVTASASRLLVSDHRALVVELAGPA